MLNVGITVQNPAFKTSTIARNSARAADEIADSVKNYVKLALVGKSKIATGKTLQSIAVQFVLNSPSRGIFTRNVIGSKSWLNIQFGRRAGGKMPVQVVAGVTKKGGKLFQPAPELLQWFLALNIPRVRWFPIMRAIARRGIKPTNIRDSAIHAARQRINDIANRTAQTIAAELAQGRA